MIFNETKICWNIAEYWSRRSPDRSSGFGQVHVAIDLSARPNVYIAECRGGLKQFDACPPR